MKHKRSSQNPEINCHYVHRFIIMPNLFYIPEMFALKQGNNWDALYNTLVRRLKIRVVAYMYFFVITVKICASCKTRRTPLWRDSEDGTPLCNACGIRYVQPFCSLCRIRYYYILGTVLGICNVHV